MRLKPRFLGVALTVIVLASFGTACSKGVNGEMVYGKPESAKWFDSASFDTRYSYFERQCAGYGTQIAVDKVAECIDARVYGRPEGSFWFNEAPTQLQMKYFKNKCLSYGYEPVGKSELAQSTRDELSKALDRNIARRQADATHRSANADEDRESREKWDGLFGGVPSW